MFVVVAHNIHCALNKLPPDAVTIGGSVNFGTVAGLAVLNP